MYYYIVDPQNLTQQQFERVQNFLYSSLSEYLVSGEVVRVTGLRTINQLTETAIQRGVKTLIAVGDEDTLHQVINALKGRDVVIGFIPLADSEIGQILGIKDISSAAKTLGQRRIEELDLGQVNQVYFLSQLSFGLGQKSLFDVKFSADNEYTASLTVAGGIIRNSLTGNTLEITLLPKLSKWQTFLHRKKLQKNEFETIPGISVVHVRKIEILSPEGLPLRASDKVIAKTPATIEVIPKALKIIVGKDRKF